MVRWDRAIVHFIGRNPADHRPASADFHGLLMGRIQDSSARSGLPSIPMMHQLFDIVHQAVKLPLLIHLFLPPKCEVVQPLVVPQIPEHWLHRDEAPAVELSPALRIDGALHPFAGIYLACPGRNISAGSASSLVS